MVKGVEAVDTECRCLVPIELKAGLPLADVSKMIELC